MTTALALPGLLRCELREYGLHIPADLSFEEFEQELERSLWLEEASPWFKVDLIAFGWDKWGEDASQALPTREEDPRGQKQAKLKQAAWMAPVWPPAARVHGISYTHHRLATEMAQKDRREAVALLEAARDAVDEHGDPKPWSTRVFANEVRARMDAIPVTPTEAASEPACAADRPLGLDDLLPEWRRRAEATGAPLAYLQALLDTRSAGCFGRWID